jgi:transposase
MGQAAAAKLLSDAELAGMSAPELVTLARSQGETIEDLERQLSQANHRIEWFERQYFGTKSERLRVLQNAQQLSLGEALGSAPAQETPAAQEQTVAAHKGRKAKRDVGAEVPGENLPFFDESRVPVLVIPVPNPDIEGLGADEYEIIGEKFSYKLAQRPASYVVLKYVRTVVKRLDTQVISAPPAPGGVLEGSRADVSFLAGSIVEKLDYYLPLNRQHRRLEDCGIDVSRQWLTQLFQQSSGLLEPIYDAQLDSIIASRVKTMDETTIKAGRKAPGKMQLGYFWPVYGDRDEVCFPFFPSREGSNILSVLGTTHPPGSVLLTDGYAPYASYAKQVGIINAQCWSHSRREFFEAQTADPEGVLEALQRIGGVYGIEAQIKDRGLTGEAKRQYRQLHSKPLVDAFFTWVNWRILEHGLRPTTPFTRALNYVRERRTGLEVFLDDPDVPLDTNHLERVLRPIPMGRKNFLFCWTETGAKQLGILQSLVSTCRLHEVDAYTYLVDVLQRVSVHPASRVAELTPRLWKQHFAANPMRSVVQTLGP